MAGSLALGCAPSSPPRTPHGDSEDEPPLPERPSENSPAADAAASARADILHSPPGAVPPPPERCRAAPPLPASAVCSSARAELAAGLALVGAERDIALANLEPCSNFAPGVLRALRAELGEAECADRLVEAVVGEQAREQPAISDDVRQTLVALGLGARLRRLAVDPPAAPASRDKEALQAYFADALFPWIEQQAAAIYEMALQGKELDGYAKGVVAVESGNADMRFVEIARAAPIPKEIEDVPEARDVYYATLDEALEPRKARGTAAALVGLRAMAEQGIIHNERVELARELLSLAYGGRRINALDLLLLPELPAMEAKSPEEVIASAVPTPYAGALLGAEEPTTALLRAHLERGLPVGLRRQVQDLVEPRPLMLLLLARGLFEQGRTYFRAEDFQDATRWSTRLLEPEWHESEDEAARPGPPVALSRAQLSRAHEEWESAALLRATSTALMAGPKDATELIAEGPRFAEQLGNLVFLDSLASQASELGGSAAFNAAYLRELVVQPGDPEAWAGLAARYQAASRTLKGEARRSAQERADACREIEREVRTEKRGQ